ncbi:hypothetical protein [Spirosoma endbachense]|uniref:Uncharacterized protein n=1 Tax=Spirosoma endbachense TaxID=2666025 RepID=A0A6P1W2S9_9BACT|nr:hypothetical protein [Spirosoma endbachense]QHV97996.1 hypothetical protein GJR95_24610 [Spirosoma endbachense]
MRLFCLITVLMLSIVGIVISQPTNPRFAKQEVRQKFPGLSHIEIDLGQRNALLIAFDQYAQVLARKNIDSVLHLFMTDYQKVEDTTQSPTRATHALFRLGETNQALALRYTPQPTTNFQFQEDDKPVEVKTQQDTLQILWTSLESQDTPNNFSLHLLVNSLSDIERLLKAGGMNQKLNQALESVRDYKNHDLTSPQMAFTLLQSADNKSRFLNPGSAKNPFLEITAGVGVGLIRNQWVPSLNFDVQFIPSQYQRVGYVVGYTANFFFDRPATTDQFSIFRNDFLNVGVVFYHKNKTGRFTNFNRQIASFYVGIPVHRKGPYFESNTIRLGSTVYQNKFIKVQPELYMNGFFKKVYPGVRLVVGF